MSPRLSLVKPLPRPVSDAEGRDLAHVIQAANARIQRAYSGAFVTEAGRADAQAVAADLEVAAKRLRARS